MDINKLIEAIKDIRKVLDEIECTIHTLGEKEDSPAPSKEDILPIKKIDIDDEEFYRVINVKDLYPSNTPITIYSDKTVAFRGTIDQISFLGDFIMYSRMLKIEKEGSGYNIYI